jgi:serine/threonine-protein kinase
MGEVYRADDLELGQAVALKFIAKGTLLDPAALDRFRGEVRNARQITHPNVCRVYDIGEHEGRIFLSMEYVDGEDLSSLLRRIGRLPVAKATELAQQICAGLAAAHSRQILHRDLKPSNVLVDGRGHAHITDFGLATRANEDTGDVAGTPAYMAPEQFRGDPATARTDLYGLGLVLYELYTGKRPFEGTKFADFKQQHLQSIPPSLVETVRDLDPGIEKTILRCLEKDPAKRPLTVAALSASLPGANPLAAMIAAGETPSPEMVAASGEEGALSRTTALLLSAVLVICVAATVYFARYAHLINLFPADKSPEYLIDHARDLASGLGDVPSPNDYAWWFTQSSDDDRMLSRMPAPQRYRAIASIYPSVLQFRYRQSPRPLQSSSHRRIRPLDPAPYYSGEVSVALDTKGRLVSFSEIPPEKGDPPSGDPAPNWDPFWQAASLSPERVTPIPALWTPDVAADRSFAWKGEAQGYTFEVHAASRGGKPVFFQLFRPDEPPARMVEIWRPGGNRFAAIVFGILGAATLLFSLYFAYLHLRSGRGDRRGALRFAFTSYAVGFIFLILTSHHLYDVGYEWEWLEAAIGMAAGIPLTMAVFYLALEPYIRRTWPELLVSWTRILSGEFTDPLVGRDVFLGILLGAAQVSLWVSLVAAPYFLPVRGETPYFDPTTLQSAPAFLGDTLQKFNDSLTNSIGALSMMFLMGKLTKRKWIAATTAGLLWAVLNVSGYNYSLEIPVALVSGAIAAYTIARLGLLATFFMFDSIFVLLSTPFSFDFGRWYADRGVVVLLAIVGLAVYGMRVSLGSKQFLGAQPN